MTTTVDLVVATVRHYTDWLNRRWEADNPGERGPYKYGDFTLAANNSPIILEDTWGGGESYYRRITVSVYDGDDGGRTLLTAFWDKPERFDKDPPELRYLIQEFDTSMQFLMEEGKWEDQP